MSRAESRFLEVMGCALKFICLHGFLGSPIDYSFLEDEFDLIALSVDELIELDLSQIQAKIEQLVPYGEKVCLVGYSFGARMSIGLFLQNPSFYTNLALLAGHLGLNSSEQKNERAPFEMQMIKLLRTLSPEEFIHQWNQYSLFESDADLVLNNQNFQIAPRYFERWGLSKQSYYGDELKHYKEKVQWHFGLADIKYTNYAKTHLNEFNVTYHDGTGHRLLQNKKLINQIFRTIDD